MKNFTGGPQDPNDAANNPFNPNDPDDITGSGGMNSGFIQIPSNQNNNGQDTFDPDTLLINYNEKFKSAGPTLFRDQIVYQLSSVLIGKNKPNCILVGPAGVGKT